jgi:UrcA family protein
MNSKNFSETLSTVLVGAILAITVLALVPILASAANASDGVPQLTVHYQDLNLSTREDASILYRRINAAAFQVCGSVDPMNLARAHTAKECQDRAISQAVSAVGSPILTRVYLDKLGHNQAGNNEVAGR